MNQGKRRTLFASCAVLALAGALIAGAFLVSPSGSEAAEVQLETVDPRILESAGITLKELPASEPSPKVGKEEAKAIALRMAHGRQALEAVYAHCIRRPVLNAPCWVVSVRPEVWHRSVGPPGAAARQFTYVVELIDPETGELIRNIEGEGVP
jgi:hypothetical protein